ncbi:MAG: hypothetical protein LQ337_002206 [Flavoplaca oasis]|nr:MAG: hypothetical protein LQ337_002206 [Flavoplaca oasis]
MHAALLRMQQLVCANRQSLKVNEFHTATSLSVSCPDVGHASQRQVLQWAMMAMRQGQARKGPAALSGRIITTGHPEELWTEFTTIVQGVPPVATPGWGTNTWCNINVRPGNLAPMQIRMLSQGPITDKWYSYFTFALLLQIFKHLQTLPNRRTTAARPIDIRLVPQGIRFRLRPYHHGSTEFTLEQEALVLYALMQMLKDMEARDLTISVIVGGASVAVGYLDVAPPRLDSSAKNSTGVEVSSLTVDMNGSRLMPSQLDIVGARGHVEQVCGR